VDCFAQSLRLSTLLDFRFRKTYEKARIVRFKAGSRAADAHIRYLQRDGTTREGGRGQLYGPDTDNADGKAFAEHGREDGPGMNGAPGVAFYGCWLDINQPQNQNQPTGSFRRNCLAITANGTVQERA
jgi:hypothetical protein